MQSFFYHLYVSLKNDLRTKSLEVHFTHLGIQRRWIILNSSLMHNLQWQKIQRSDEKPSSGIQRQIQFCSRSHYLSTAPNLDMAQRSLQKVRACSTTIKSHFPIAVPGRHNALAYFHDICQTILLPLQFMSSKKYQLVISGHFFD